MISTLSVAIPSVPSSAHVMLDTLAQGENAVSETDNHSVSFHCLILCFCSTFYCNGIVQLSQCLLILMQFYYYNYYILCSTQPVWMETCYCTMAQCCPLH